MNKNCYLENKKIRICVKDGGKMPYYSSEGDSGFELSAVISQDESVDKEANPDLYKCVLKPLERHMFHTGIYMEIPEGCEVQIRPKSGQALKKGLIVLNTPGTVDEQYRGEICVIIANVSNENVEIKQGERIAQGVLMPVYNSRFVEFEPVDDVNKDTERSDGGFGHNGIM